MMADNAYPGLQDWSALADTGLVFDETWSYRSWQERGSLDKRLMKVT